MDAGPALGVHRGPDARGRRRGGRDAQRRRLVREVLPGRLPRRRARRAPRLRGRPRGRVALARPAPERTRGVGYVWDVQIDAAERGSGLGRAAMLLAESHVRSRGGSALALNVFGFNTAARALYESLGYETTSLQMRKPLA
ncbi:hypothetical protein C5B93_06100 [Rathayibacter sp. AY1A2]|uniref:GNAT family N-acetyltransferase n=1 Tax=unclassified Rathayibacter TaxID=2609250 RepID=UPI000CE7DCE4|nr:MULTISPECIES: GNAT family N-acetyltransferase [unclassified Rathayibacter]PPF38971.1 hypothetical protein C5B93_06100 [Rathayibacter sp. AY1A2]PPI07272.1 hypothetical protein C5C63_08025 [Rathayibacter sp. AY1B8]